MTVYSVLGKNRALIATYSTAELARGAVLYARERNPHAIVYWESSNVLMYEQWVQRLTDLPVEESSLALVKHLDGPVIL